VPRAFRTRRGVHSLLGLLLEFALITAAVFLGLLADEWREGRQEQRQAATSLALIRAEVATNRVAVDAVQDYHRELRQRVSAFLQSDGPKTWPAFAQVQFGGVRAPKLERTALDIAVATGALTNVDPELAYAISRTYTVQARIERLHDGFRESMLSPMTFATPDATGSAIAIAAYLGEVLTEEPKLLESYAALTGQLDGKQSPSTPRGP
jgi:hypothetical protein